MSDLAPRDEGAAALSLDLPRPARLPGSFADGAPPEPLEEHMDDDSGDSYELVVEEASDPEAEEVADAVEEEVRQSRVPSLPPEALVEAAAVEVAVAEVAPVVAEPAEALVEEASEMSEPTPELAEAMAGIAALADAVSAAHGVDGEPMAQGELDEPPRNALAESDEIELVDDELLHDAEEPVFTTREFSAPPAPPPDVILAATKPPVVTGALAPSAAAPAAAPPAPAEPAPPKAKRKRPWYEDFFSDDYLRTVRPLTAREIAKECDFIEQAFGLPYGSTILDVGCGLGLHAIELTARGYIVVGLDLSLPMLSRAGDEAQDRQLRINFLHQDMREMGFVGAFDGLLCWGTTFGYFDDETNRRVVQRFHQALRPGGRLLLDSVNRDYVVRSQPNLVWFEGDGCICMEETGFNYFSSRLEVSRQVILDEGQQRTKAYSIRLYSLHEIGQILHQNSFRVMEVTGSHAAQGVYFGADSPRLTILAERRLDDEPAAAPARGDTPEPPP